MEVCSIYTYVNIRCEPSQSKMQTFKTTMLTVIKGKLTSEEIIRKRNVENDAKVDLKLLTMEDQQDSKRPMEDQLLIVQ